MSAKTEPVLQQNEAINDRRPLDADIQYKALDMETFHGLERFRDALDDYKNSNPDKPNREDLRQDPAVLSEVYSKAFGIEDKFMTLNNFHGARTDYQNTLIQAAGNAYALTKDRNARIPDFSYDSPQSSKNNEIIFYGNDFNYGTKSSNDNYSCDCYMCLNNLDVSAEDARLGRGQKYSNLWAGTETWDIDWYKDYNKIIETSGTGADRTIYDPEEHHVRYMAMFKADMAPIVHLSNDGKIELVGFAPDMSTIKGTDCSQRCTQDNLRESYDIARTLEETVNPLLRDGSYKNDAGLQAVREGRDILDKMAVMPSNEDALSNVMSKSIEREAVTRNKVLAYYDDTYFDMGRDVVHSYSYEITKTPEGKYNWSKYHAEADIAEVETPYSVKRSRDEISKEQAMNMVNGTMSMATGKTDSFAGYSRELTAYGKQLRNEFTNTYVNPQEAIPLAGYKLTENDNHESAELFKIADNAFRYDQYDSKQRNSHKSIAVDEHTAAEIINQTMNDINDASCPRISHVTNEGVDFYNTYLHRSADIIEKASEKSVEKEEAKVLAVRYNEHNNGDQSWNDTYELLKQGENFSMKTTEGYYNKSFAEPMSKENAENIIKKAAANKDDWNLREDGKAYYDNMQASKTAEKPVEKAASASVSKYYADFSKASGNSRENVEMIAIVNPNRGYYKPDANGKKQLVAIYVDTQVNDSKLSQADVAAGNGQINAHLFSELKKGKFNNAVPWSPSQVDKLKETCGNDAYVDKSGIMYIPLKANVVPMQRTVNGKQTTVGYMPNTGTIQRSEYGALTKADLAKHYANAKALTIAKFNKNSDLGVENIQNADKNKQSDEQFS